jgi:molecular chaperone GrpE
LMDDYKIALADLDNTRKMADQHIAKEKKFAVRSFSRDLLEVVDNMDRAISSITHDVVDRENKHFKALYEGVLMTEKSFLRVLKSHGIEKHNPAGGKFNPEIHQALGLIPDPTKEDGTISLVEQVGFMMHGVPLRPARVLVVQNPE